MGFTFESGDSSAPEPARRGPDVPRGQVRRRAADGTRYPQQVHAEPGHLPTPTLASLTSPRLADPATIPPRRVRSRGSRRSKVSSRYARNLFTWVIATAVVVAVGIAVTVAAVDSPRFEDEDGLAAYSDPTTTGVDTLNSAIDTLAGLVDTCDTDTDNAL